MGPVEELAVDPQALDLVPRVYEAASHPDAWDPFLEALARRMRGAVPALVLIDPESGTTLLECAPASDPAWQRAYLDRYQRLDLRRRALICKPEGTVIAGHALLPDEVLERSEFYNDFLRPQGFFHIALAQPIRRRARVAAIRVIRSLGEEPFHDEDLAPLRTLVPHLRAALDLHCELTEARRRSAGLSGALAALGVGALLLDAGGRVVFANAEAEKLIAAGDGLGIRGRRLRLDSPHEDTALERLAASRSGGGALKISRRSGRSALEARVIPLPTGAGELGAAAGSTLVFVREPERASALDPETLRGLYGFTPAELRVATLVAEGRSAPATARALGISVETVRTHHKRLCEKTGARGRGQLIRMLSGSLASLREPGG